MPPFKIHYNCDYVSILNQKFIEQKEYVENTALLKNKCGKISIYARFKDGGRGNPFDINSNYNVKQTSRLRAVEKVAGDPLEHVGDSIMYHITVSPSKNFNAYIRGPIKLIYIPSKLEDYYNIMYRDNSGNTYRGGFSLAK